MIGLNKYHGNNWYIRPWRLYINLLKLLGKRGALCIVQNVIMMVMESFVQDVAQSF